MCRAGKYPRCGRSFFTNQYGLIVDYLAEYLREMRKYSFADAGAKRILLPMSSVIDLPSVPGELFAKFQTSFYSDPVDAVFKALGVERARVCAAWRPRWPE
jgi:predicted ATP-dependent Lon-type protease